MTEAKKPSKPLPTPKKSEDPAFASFTLDDKTGMGIPSVSRLLNRIDVQHTMRYRREKSSADTAPIQKPALPKEEAHPQISTTPAADLPSSRTQWFDLARVIANRSNSEASAGSTPSANPPSSDPAPVAMEKQAEIPLSIPLSAAPETAQAETALPSIQPSKRNRAKKAATVLARWKRESLSNSSDPIGRAASILLPAGATDLLFLSRHPLAKGDSFSVVATAAFTDNPQFIACWSGLKWAPDVVPELWKELISKGVVQLAPPGEKTLPSSERNVIRAAFGVRQEDWMIVLRSGTAEQARGILVVLSKGNLMEKMREVLPLLSLEPSSSKSAA